MYYGLKLRRVLESLRVISGASVIFYTRRRTSHRFKISQVRNPITASCLNCVDIFELDSFIVYDKQ